MNAVPGGREHVLLLLHEGLEGEQVRGAEGPVRVLAQLLHPLVEAVHGGEEGHRVGDVDEDHQPQLPGVLEDRGQAGVVHRDVAARPVPQHEADVLPELDAPAALGLDLRQGAVDVAVEVRIVQAGDLNGAEIDEELLVSGHFPEKPVDMRAVHGVQVHHVGHPHGPVAGHQVPGVEQLLEPLPGEELPAVGVGVDDLELRPGEQVLRRDQAGFGLEFIQVDAGRHGDHSFLRALRPRGRANRRRPGSRQ